MGGATFPKPFLTQQSAMITEFNLSIAAFFEGAIFPILKSEKFVNASS